MFRNILIMLAASIFVLVSGNAASARPRDLALSNAYRCNAYADNRDWLDCYYGAAQAVRDGLRMSPAPQQQLQLVAAPAGPGPSAPDRQLRDRIMLGTAGCTLIEAERGWLNCYYAAAAPMRTSLNLAPLPGSVRVMPVAPVSEVAKPVPSSGRQVGHMLSYAFDTHGWFTATLDNGQVWQQVAGDTDYAHWTLPAQKYAVRIAPGFMGSTNLRVIGHGGTYKVIRLK